jgi:hypothetical protein
MCRVAGSPDAAHNDRVTTTVSHIESPSVQIAWGLRMAEIGINLPYTPFFERIQQPDPRVPKGHVDFVAWTYEGTTARPALGQPDSRAVEAVVAIARQRYHLPTWTDLAAGAAAQLGPGWAQHLAAVMVHPPAAPEHLHPLDWVPRIQVAAALVIACGEAGYRTLQTLALGPADWVVDAAVIALGEMAMRNPAVRGEVEQLFAHLRAQVPKEGFTSYPYPLACMWLRLTGNPELAAWRDRILRGEEAGTSASGCIGLVDGINMEDYAEFEVKQELVQLGNRDHGTVASLAAQYGVQMRRGNIAYSEGWREAINEDPRLGLAFAQTKARINLSLQGIDPDSEEARLSHRLMAGEGLDQQEELRKAQAAQQQLAAGGGGDPDPVVFPGQRVAKLSDYVGLMKRLQTGDMNGALAAFGLDMGSYMQVMQAWGTKLGVDPTLNAKFGQMMVG